LASKLAKAKVKETAGTLLWRIRKNRMEVLLVHPSGNYNRKSPWSIPKGLPESLETMEEAARRETIEETGVRPVALRPLGYVDYTKSKKRIHCFFGQAPSDENPWCASWEVDRAEFMSLEKARKEIHPDQLELLDRFMIAMDEFRDGA
jgi:predicted NUDIX family NTP pyrophosphohydrolase